DGRGEGVGALTAALSAAVNGYVEANRREDAWALLKNMLREGLRPGVKSFNGLLKTCRSWKEVSGLLETMRSFGVCPDVASYTAAMGAC
ncbi:unnamed protein product, partial [Discosporangium mesarthrocarpum]